MSKAIIKNTGVIGEIVEQKDNEIKVSHEIQVDGRTKTIQQWYTANALEVIKENNNEEYLQFSAELKEVSRKIIADDEDGKVVENTFDIELGVLPD